MKGKPDHPVLMPLRYPDFCRGCGKKITRGSVALWLGKKDGVKHVNCKNKMLDAEYDW